MKKTRNHGKFSQPIAWVDLVFNIMMSFAFLFVLSYILINVSKKSLDMEKPKAEALVTLQWPDYAVDDLDLWLLLPNGRTVAYTAKETNVISLERDDLGQMSNVETDQVGTIRLNQTRKEIITFRALPVGKYQISIHYFSARGGVDVARQLPVPQPVPTPPYSVKVEVTKLNPAVKILFSKSIVIQPHVGEETTVVSFEIDEEGAIKNFRTNNLEKFVPLKSGFEAIN